MTSSIDQKKWALRFTGDQAVDGGAVDGGRLKSGFTLEAWVRPAAIAGGIAAYEGDRFQGRPVAFAPGRYDDLSKFRIGAGHLSSLRIPPGYRAVLFEKTGCGGAAKTFANDVAHLGDWHQRAHALVVIDTRHRKQEHAVVYADRQFAGVAEAFDLRSYPDLSELTIGEKSISSVDVPPGLEVTLYEQPGCQGASLRLQGEVAYLGDDWNDRACSAIVSLAAVPGAGDQVIAYDRHRFGGAAQAFKIGCYRDLSSKAVGKAAISSLQVPPGLQVVLFDQPGLTGESRTLDASASDLGAWDDRAQSLFVARLLGGGGPGVRLFQIAGNKGKVWHVPLGAYNDLSAVGGTAALEIPAGFEVILYDQKDFKGHRTTLKADAQDLGDWKGRAQSAVVARRCGVFDNPAGSGLSLEILPAPGLRPRQERFAGARVRTGRWCHLAATWDGAELAYWLGGRKVAARPRKQVSFAGDWKMGEGFEGEIGLVAVRAGARDAKNLALRRFELPDKQDPDLVAAWTLEEGSQAAVELLSRSKAAIPPGEAFWVHAALPADPTHTSLGQELQLRARQHGQALLQQAKADAHGKIEKAHKKAEAHLNEVQARATALAHATGFEAIRYLSGGQLASVNPKGRSDQSILSIAASEHQLQRGEVAVLWAKRVAITSGGAGFSVYSLETGEQLRTFKGYGEFSSQIIVSPDGRLTANAINLNEAKVWDVESGKRLYSLVAVDKKGGMYTKVRKVCFYDDGRKLITVSERGGIGDVVRAWDLSNGNRIQSCEGKLDCLDVAVDTSGRRAVLADGDGHLRVWRLDSGQLEREFATPAVEVQILPDGRRALTRHRKEDSTKLKLWDLDNRTCLHTLGHSRDVEAFEVYRNGARVISTERGGGMRIWDLDLGVELKRLKRPGNVLAHGGTAYHVAVHEGKQIAVSCSQDNSLKVWDLRSATCLRTLRGHRSSVYAVSLDPGGTRAVSYGGDGTIRVWDLAFGQVLSDIAVDPAAEATYVARTLPSGGVGRYAGAQPRWLKDRQAPVYAVTIDPTGSDEAHRFVYWIEGDGDIYRMRMDGQGDVTAVFENAAPGRDREWQLAIDPKRQRLFWSNGREIWSGPLNDAGTVSGAQVIVTSGRSPHPLALAVNDYYGDLFWVDQELESVRSASWDGSDLSDLYEAPEPRPGLALDLGSKRIYWNAEHRRLVEGAVIDDPGLFCWLQDRGEDMPAQRVVALEDTRLAGARWRPPKSPLAASDTQEPSPLVLKDRRVLHFEAETDHVDLGPLFLDCSHGFSVEAWVRYESFRDDSPIIDLSNGPARDNVIVANQDTSAEVLFQIYRGGTSREFTCKGLTAGIWIYIAATLDATGKGRIYLNGGLAAEEQLLLPRPLLRTRNYVGRSSWESDENFHGQIAMLRLWNTCLDEEVIRARCRDPLADQTRQAHSYGRSLMEYRDGRPYLMSAAMDGLEPAVPLFELGVDRGFALQSKTAAAHEKLVGAQRERAAVQMKARLAAAAARNKARDKVQAAHEQNVADHAAAHRQVADAKADGDRRRKDAHARLKAAPGQASERIARARAAAKRDQADGEREAQRIKDDADQKKRIKIAKANRDLAAARRDKDKAEAKKATY